MNDRLGIDIDMIFTIDIDIGTPAQERENESSRVKSRLDDRCGSRLFGREHMASRGQALTPHTHCGRQRKGGSGGLSVLFDDFLRCSHQPGDVFFVLGFREIHTGYRSVADGVLAEGSAEGVCVH